MDHAATLEQRRPMEEVIGGSMPLASIAVIAIGLSLLVGGGMTMEALCGLAGVVLGILALLDLDPVTLVSVSVLIYGGAWLMASLATARLNEMRTRLAAAEPNRAMPTEDGRLGPVLRGDGDHGLHEPPWSA